jgi:hypothetical protein
MRWGLQCITEPVLGTRGADRGVLRIIQGPQTDQRVGTGLSPR